MHTKSRQATQGNAAPAKKVPKKVTQTYLRNSALYYLQRFAASVHQFKTAMGRKIERSCRAHPEQDKDKCYEWLDKLCAEFIDIGYLNDDAYLKAAVRGLRANKGLSARMVLSKMQQKGFEEHIIKQVLAETAENEEDENAELTAALRFAQRKKIGPYHPVPPRKTYEQQLNALARGGFSFDICKQVMGKLPETTD